MRRMTLFLLALTLVAGCSSTSEAPITDAASAVSTTAAVTTTSQVTLSGMVTIGESWYPSSDGWLSESHVYNGDPCHAQRFTADSPSVLGPGSKVTVRSAESSIIGIGELEEGGVAGLDGSGLELPPESEFQEWFADHRLEKAADCSFPFSVVLTEDSAFYEVGMGEFGSVNYTHAELMTDGWHVDLYISDPNP